MKDFLQCFASVSLTRDRNFYYEKFTFLYSKSKTKNLRFSTPNPPTSIPGLHSYLIILSLRVPPFHMSFQVCPYCERLYASHSLPLHLPRCSDNPHNKEQHKRAQNKKSRGRQGKKDEDRPLTRSLSRNTYGKDHPKDSSLFYHRQF